MNDHKICLSCGNLEWRQRQYCHTTKYGSMYHTINNSDGSADEDWESDDESGDDDWEDDGGPVCADCDSEDLLDLEELTDEQVLTLSHFEDEDDRIRAAKAMLHGEAPEDDPREGSPRIGGRKVWQP
jgi:hypothetical protein